MKKYKKAYVEITNICNLNCAFCPKTTREPKMMSTNEFAHICEQIKPLCDYLYLHLMGEPLLHKNIGDFLNIAQKNELKVNITTNGTLIDTVAPTLLAAPSLRKMSFSLHSFEGNLANYENATTIKELEKYLNKICAFCEEATKKGIICELRLWNESGDLVQLNRYILNYIKTFWDIAKDISLSSNNGTKLKENLYLGSERVFKWPDINTHVKEHRTFCYGLRDQFAIHVDGTVVPCCLDSNGDIPLGNVFDKPLGEILACPRAIMLYNNFSKGIAHEKLCQNCTFAR